MAKLEFPQGDSPPKAFQVMAKPIGPICNLDCTYCYYLEKEHILNAKSPSWRMQEDLLEQYVRQYIEAHSEVPIVEFAWQGGEPTLLGLEFFQKAVAFQKKYNNGKQINNAFQTNGTLLTEDWCHFFRDEGFLIGLSIDGPRGLHNVNRPDKRGQDTFDRVVRGIELMREHEVEFNTLTVVNAQNVKHPLKVYHFLKKIGSGYIQLIPLVERLADMDQKAAGYDHAPPSHDGRDYRDLVSDQTVRPEDFGQFLCDIFDEWVRKDVGSVFVQHFEEALGKWAGAPGGLCIFRERCGMALVLEHNGDLFSCDHFVYPEYKLGNIRDADMKEMVSSQRQRDFGNAKADTLPEYCRKCEVRFACNGGCPKKRFINTPSGEPGLNYLCAGYKKYFKHVGPYMEIMANMFSRGTHPSAIMELLAKREGRKPPEVKPPTAETTKYKRVTRR